MADLNPALASVLVGARQRLGMSQADAARKAGIENRQTVHAWERGVPPMASNLRAYLDALEATPDERRAAWAAFGIPESDLAEPPEAA